MLKISDTEERELLRLAAKVEGNGVEFCEGTGLAYYDTVCTGLWWNPLHRDADAFRLAVRCLQFYTLQYTREDYEACEEDGMAATRLAIVRAVAEIGRRMEEREAEDE